MWAPKLGQKHFRNQCSAFTRHPVHTSAVTPSENQNKLAGCDQFFLKTMLILVQKIPFLRVSESQCLQLAWCTSQIN